MIQRIQTIYLLIVTILAVTCMSLPIGAFVENSSISDLFNLYISRADGVKDYAPWALFVIQLLSALISFVAIFLFKKRIIQMRFSIFNIILNVGYYISAIAFVFMLKGDTESFTMNWPICMPLINIILSWLAIRAIGKDEMLVKAYDRLR